MPSRPDCMSVVFCCKLCNVGEPPEREPTNISRKQLLAVAINVHPRPLHYNNHSRHSPFPRQCRGPQPPVAPLTVAPGRPSLLLSRELPTSLPTQRQGHYRPVPQHSQEVLHGGMELPIASRHPPSDVPICIVQFMVGQVPRQ
ncbi:hypothetical protein Vretimale_233 [Volvox reticuliferus]|uniref:Uncharacterized protein n=1 Tax=Volvox reticuliferus TaxID=1737510 RepID=A0A8J4D1D0_9CHLO|nr:hypothetical protein Vretifemale_8310 [Volvox reticuliferus]GIL93868.1 hypothetical protein Vretimale_233 [Volvox reticuliferus]